MSAERLIQVRYFASMREQRGVGSEALRTSAANPAALYKELARLHGFSLPPNYVRFAINGAFVDPTQALQEGDELCLIPPVAGG